MPDTQEPPFSFGELRTKTPPSDTSTSEPVSASHAKLRQSTCGSPVPSATSCSMSSHAGSSSRHRPRQTTWPPFPATYKRPESSGSTSRAIRSLGMLSSSRLCDGWGIGAHSVSAAPAVSRQNRPEPVLVGSDWSTVSAPRIRADPADASVG